jgi:hypothetical protein
MWMRLNLYVKKEDETVVDKGKKCGILPSKALMKGYEVLMGKSARYNLLEDERTKILKRLSEIEVEMDELREDIDIDVNDADEVIRRLLRVYHREHFIPPEVMETNRVHLNMSKAQFKEFVKENVIEPYERQEIELIGLGI